MDSNPLDGLIAEAERLEKLRDENWAVVESISDFNNPKRKQYLEFYLNCIRGLGDLAPRLLAVAKAARDFSEILPRCHDTYTAQEDMQAAMQTAAEVLP